jgi:hypothetical protein
MEGFWWSDPWFFLKNERALRVFPTSIRLRDPESVNRVSLLLAYVLSGAWFVTGDVSWLVYLLGSLVLIYWYTTSREWFSARCRRGPASMPLSGPSRNVRPYQQRLADSLLNRPGEIEPRMPIEASKQRKAFARQMPLTGDEVPFSQIYETGGGRWNRLRPVGRS